VKDIVENIYTGLFRNEIYFVIFIKTFNFLSY